MKDKEAQEKIAFKREIKYEVIKLKDIEKYLIPMLKQELQVIIETIQEGRKADGKARCNRYVVVNEDESYAEDVWMLIEKDKNLEELGYHKPLDRPELREKGEELVEKCMPTLERFEEVEKQVFFPIPKPVEFAVTIRVYASTMSREAVRKTLALIPDIPKDRPPLLSNEEEDACTPTDKEIDTYLLEPDDAIAKVLTTQEKRLVARVILYGKKIAQAQWDIWNEWYEGSK